MKKIQINFEWSENTKHFLDTLTDEEKVKLWENLTGMAKKEANSPQETNALTMEKVYTRLASKLGWKQEKLKGWIKSLKTICPMAAFYMLGNQIAIELDRKYKDHIRNCKTIFTITPLGEYREIETKKIKDYKNIAAFRNLEDLKFAWLLLCEELPEMLAQENGK